jgi:hypothetical protein
MNEKKAKKKMKKLLKAQKKAVDELWDYPQVRKTVGAALLMSKQDLKKKKRFRKVLNALAAEHMNTETMELERGMLNRAKERDTEPEDMTDQDLIRHFADYAVVDEEDDKVIHKPGRNKLLAEVSKKLLK